MLKPDPFDPEGAKKLFADAGYPKGFPLKFWDIGGGGIVTTFDQAVVGYFRKVGVNAELVAIEQAALAKMYQPKHTPPMWDTIRATSTG
ncbi:MAG: hypothetical protein Q7O66_20440, partial [Dehalococcoidia bacterium]|nr:hypothetical protein [Dehalococcoidia bacterium]